LTLNYRKFVGTLLTGLLFISGLLISGPLLQAQTQVDNAQAANSPSDGEQPKHADKSKDVANNIDKDKKDAPLERPDVLVKNLAKDQAAIWTSPFKVRASDLKWIVPFAGITTGLIVTDQTAAHEASGTGHINTSKKFSDYGLAAAAGSSAGIYLLGLNSGDRLMRETGVLGGEAMLDAFGVDEALKFAFRRDRPFEGNGSGKFFQSGSQTSMPSAHATLSFAFASLLAHEYPGWLTQTLAYGGATAISLARVTGQQHFPSDVFVGGTIGYLIGRQVYRAHHDQELDGGNYGNFMSDPVRVSVTSAGSTYVPLDSWIYPALERLFALGVLNRPFLGIRPWTRTAVAQMLEGGPAMEDSAQTNNDEESKLYSSLRTEFARELGIVEDGGTNESVRVETLYSGVYGISGKPLNDSYHFGQTIINNSGRPYQEGFNATTGFTARAEEGHFFFYASGEYQRAPGAGAEPLNVRTEIARVDANPIQPAVAVQAVSQFRLLDTYAGFTAFGNQVSVGKQSLWWGPGEGGAMIFSDNSEPIYMLRLNRTLPLYIPYISKLLGPLRYDNFFGKLSGHNFPPDPFFLGDKISFQPTENLEFGFSRTAVFAGQGKTPLTFGTFIRSFTSANDVPFSDKGTPRDPGARHGAFDFSYRLPFLRKWVTLYSDSVVHDDVSPIDAPRRAFFVPGFYLSHFPKLNKLDLRVESGYTDNPVIPNQGGQFVYWEVIYHDAYTNKGNLMGSWIGRQGKGTQIWSHYWLSPQSTIEVSYRNAKISPEFITGGATQNDFSAGTRLRIRKSLELLTKFQYEQWSVPVLAPNRKSDFLSTIQLTFWPPDLVKSKPN